MKSILLNLSKDEWISPFYCLPNVSGIKPKPE